MIWTNISWWTAVVLFFMFLVILVTFEMFDWMACNTNKHYTLCPFLNYNVNFGVFWGYPLNKNVWKTGCKSSFLKQLKQLWYVKPFPLLYAFEHELILHCNSSFLWAIFSCWSSDDLYLKLLLHFYNEIWFLYNGVLYVTLHCVLLFFCRLCSTF